MKTLAVEWLEELIEDSNDEVFDYLCTAEHGRLKLILNDVKRIQDYAWMLAQEAHATISMTPEEHESMTPLRWQEHREAIERRLNVDLAIIYGGVHAPTKAANAGSSDGDSAVVPEVSDGHSEGPSGLGDDEQPG